MSFGPHTLARLERRKLERTLVILIYIPVTLGYLVWRATVFNPDAPVFSAIFYGAELFGFISALFVFFLSLKYKIRQPPPAPKGLKVDVFVPVYNENLKMIRRTVLAATRIGYPHETWLLDDGNRREVQAIAEELGCHYLARKKNINAKPGNLNNALKHATGDFVCVLDADFVAQRDLLDRLLGFMRDPEVGFAQAPQEYYNINSFAYRNKKSKRILWHDQTFFFQCTQPAREYWDATTSVGTTVVYRRSALDKIGGFGEETVTEDMHTAIRLHKAGYKSRFHIEPLAYGVSPADFGEYQKTRLRWGRGNIHSLRIERVFWCRGLTWAQRLCYLHLGFMYFEGWIRMIFYLTPILILTTGVGPIDYAPEALAIICVYLLVTYFSVEELSRGFQRPVTNEQMSMARFPIYIIATFAVFRDRFPWKVSSKELPGKIPIYLILPQLLIFVGGIVAIGMGLTVRWEALRENYSLAVIAVILSFAAFFTFLAFQVMREAIRCATNKRPDYWFEIPLPVSLADSSTELCVVKEISSVGMAFSGRLSSDVRAGDTLGGQIFLPGAPVYFHAVIDKIEPAAKDPDIKVVECRFDWRSRDDADRLDLALHSVDWHRRFAFQGEFFATPLEAIQRHFGGAKPDRDTRHYDWRPMIYRTGKETSDWKFGVHALKDGAAGPVDAVLLFEDPPLGTRLECRMPFDDATRQRELNLRLPSATRNTYSEGLDTTRAFEFFVDDTGERAVGAREPEVGADGVLVAE